MRSSLKLLGIVATEALKLAMVLAQHKTASSSLESWRLKQRNPVAAERLQRRLKLLGIVATEAAYKAAHAAAA